MTPDITDARLREIAENRYAPTQSVYSDLERDLAFALLRTREERDAAVARAEAAEALLREAIRDIVAGSYAKCHSCLHPLKYHDPDCLVLRANQFLSQHSKGGDALSRPTTQRLSPAKYSDARDLCEGCPPVGYPTDATRCLPCPRRAASAAPDHNPDVRKMVPSPSDTETRHGG